VAYYLGVKLGLVFLFIVGTLWRGFPLKAVQIILLELYMDLGASLTFCAMPAEAAQMTAAPCRPDAPFFDARVNLRILLGGTCMAAAVLSGFAWGLYGPGDAGLQRGNGMAFICFLMSHVLLAACLSTSRGPALTVKLLTLPFMAWLGATAALCVAVGLSERLDGALSLRRVAPRDWGVAVAISVGATCWMEVAKQARAQAQTTARWPEHGGGGGKAKRALLSILPP